MRKQLINLTLYECWTVIFFAFTAFYYNYNLHSYYKAVEEWGSWTTRQISIGYPLITGDLPAYDLPCSVSNLFGLITYRGTWPRCACLVSMAKCIAYFLICSGFECRWSELIKRAAHLTKRTRIWPNIAHFVKCRNFRKLVRCATHLTKCAYWSNAAYMTIINK